MSEQMTRREFGGTMLMLGGVPCTRGTGQAQTSNLGLPPEVSAELERAAKDALKEAQSLEELPLDDVAPAFVFIPR